MSKLIKGDRYVYWDEFDLNVWEVLNIDGRGWAMGWRWCPMLKKSFWDMVDPTKLRHATKSEIKINKRISYK